MPTQQGELTDEMIETLLGVSDDIEIGGRVFTAGRPSLGKTLLLQRAMRKISGDLTNADVLKGMDAVYTMASLMEIASGPRKDELYRILAIILSNTRHELMSASHRESVKEFLKLNLTPTEACTLFFAIRPYEDIEGIKKAAGLNIELQRMQRVQGIKDEGGSVSFCGLTIWGGIIDQAAERYGWTLDYILWGISFANLQMLLTDSTKTIYLSDKERKRAGVSKQRGKVISGDDKEAVANFFKSIDKNQ